MKFTKKETATVLAALRCFQQHMELNGGLPGPDFEEIANDAGRALSVDQIDRLCERINCEPEPPNRVFLNVEGGIVQAVIADRRDLRVFIADYDFEGEDPDRLRSILPIEFCRADAYGKKNIDEAVSAFTKDVEQTIKEVEAL